MGLKESELILNEDGSIYHLNLKPGDIADTLIFVGDQDRVEKVTKHFDSIDFETQKREFKTQTGNYKGKRLSVISTGIGPDNIDIVLNELDALFNIDFESRTVKPKHTSLNIIRIGTSGSIQKDIAVDSFLISTYSVDMNGMLHAYEIDEIRNSKMEEAFILHSNWPKERAKPIFIQASETLLQCFQSNQTKEGITATMGGFYGPQGRMLRLPTQNIDLNTKLASFSFEKQYITNLEMETSAIYGLSRLLGHHAISLNAIIANRANGTFSLNPDLVIENLITYTLDKIIE